MSLYLTSDENFNDGINSRTEFSNEIHQDFYKDGKFNLALKEIFFDATFPTIVDHGYPHIITIIRGKEHNIREFPLEFRNDSLFQSLFQNSKIHEKGPMFMSRDFTSLAFLSQIDYNVLVEIHPRLNFAISVAYVKDVKIDSKEEMVKFLNSTMFPFHKVKPIKITASGVITIETNLNLFVSENIFNLLGFNSSVSSEFVEEIDLPSNELVQKLSDDIDGENEELQLVYSDNLERVEKTSSIYNNYRQLSGDKPKGNIAVYFKVGGENKNFNIEYELDIFNQKSLMISYPQVLGQINLLLLQAFLASIKDYVLNSGMPYNDEDVKDLDALTSFLLEKRNSIGLRNWGGLFSLKQSQRNAKFVIFHTQKNERGGQKILKRLESQTESEFIKTTFQHIFLRSKLRKVIFDETLCNLLGIEKIDKVRLSHLSIYSDDEIKFTAPLNYFKCVNYELAKSYQDKVPYELKLLLSQDMTTPKNYGPLKVFETASDSSMFLFRKKRRHVADGYFNNQVNFPNLVFVEANFIKHSLYGSKQKKILNFFPLANKKGGIAHHKFRYPIILKSVPGNLFHIKLLNEKFKSLKADIGVPTLLMLERTIKEDMFPVTIYSSDIENMSLFPDNRACHFKNKLSFPLLFSDRDNWTVSLQSIAFPKVQNIVPEVCKLYIENPTDNEITHEISVDKCHVKSIENVIFLLNQKITETLRESLPDQIPKFSMVNSKIQLETQSFDCFFEPNMMKMLGFSYSYQTGNTKFPSKTVFRGVTKPNIFIFQHQEMVIISNIVEESFYAQSRPTILKIISIPDQQEVTGYNYIQFENHDGVKIKYDRVDDIEVKLLTRKGDLINFVNEGDVKLQLEFKKIG